MRPPAFALILFLSPLGLFGSPTPAGAATRAYSVTDFDRIQVDGPYQVTLTTGRSSSARAIGGSAALDRLSIDVQGGTLRVRASASAWGGYPGTDNGPTAVTLSTRDVRSVSVNGSGTLRVDKVRGLRLAATLAGSGQLAIGAVDGDILSVTAMGSGTIAIAGRIKNLRAELHGSATLDGSGLTAGDAVIVADSAGNIKTAVTRTVKVHASGAGDVEIIGTPACTVKATGVGRVRCGKR